MKVQYRPQYACTTDFSGQMFIACKSTLFLFITFTKKKRGRFAGYQCQTFFGHTTTEIRSTFWPNDCFRIDATASRTLRGFVDDFSSTLYCVDKLLLIRFYGFQMKNEKAFVHQRLQKYRKVFARYETKLPLYSTVQRKGRAKRTKR